MKILHVDDDVDILEVTLLSLETVGGMAVLQCRSGAEAIEAAPRFLPDFLLLDVMMPEMSGEELAIRLRQMPELRKTPIAFMTAHVLPSEVERLETTFDAKVIEKPFDAMTLASEISRIYEAAGEAPK